MSFDELDEALEGFDFVADLHDEAAALLSGDSLVDDLVVLVDPADGEAAVVVWTQPHQKQTLPNNKTNKDPTLVLTKSLLLQKSSLYIFYILYYTLLILFFTFLFSFDECSLDSESALPMSPWNQLNDRR